MRHIHRGPGGYRVWSTIMDQYLTPAFSREELSAWLQSYDCLAGWEDRVRRADAAGTSCHGDTRDASQWDTERCDGCATFHHTYAPRGDGMCSRCGEGAEDVSHKPPCVLAREVRDG